MERGQCRTFGCIKKYIIARIIPLDVARYVSNMACCRRRKPPFIKEQYTLASFPLKGPDEYLPDKKKRKKPRII